MERKIDNLINSSTTTARISLPVSEVNDGNPRDQIDAKFNQIPEILQKRQFFLFQPANDFDGEVNHGQEIENGRHEDEQIKA